MINHPRVSFLRSHVNWTRRGSICHVKKFILTSSSLRKTSHFQSKPNWTKGFTQSLCSSSSVDLTSKIFMPSPQLIEADGFGVETHQVTTEDDYLLTVFRVLDKNLKGSLRGPVLLQHGLVSSSDDWIVRRPHHNNLPYLLASNGWDVWMGNFRGSRYSLKHKTFSCGQAKFWEFGVHEMGQFDVPALMNHVLDKTRADKLIYVGYSMGGTTFFVAMDQQPHLNDKIKGMIGLAPAGHIGQASSPFKMVANSLPPNLLQRILNWMNEGHVIPSKFGLERKQEQRGRQRKLSQQEFDKFVKLFDGYHPNQILNETIDMLMGHSPSDTSSRTLAHFHQLWVTDSFRQFDYGKEINLEKYNSSDPPVYDLTKVLCPVYILYGLNDKLVVPEDVLKTASQLGNVKSCEPVADPLFNHMDFVYGKDAADLVYKPSLKILESLK